MNPTCYDCQRDLLGEEITEEHIILNGLGGRLKSKALLCKQCNSKFGSDCDAALVEQFQFLTSFLQVKKQRGEINTIKGGQTPEGKNYNLENGSIPVMTKPVFKETKTGAGSEIYIEARNEQELKQILKGLAKKHPGFDVEDAVKNRSTKRKEYLKTPLKYQQQFGGELAFRSICKSAIGFYLTRGGNRENIASLLPFIKGQKQDDPVYHYNYRNVPYSEDTDEVLHMLHLVADGENKLLYCYVQYFSAYAFLVMLSKDYVGATFQSSYAYDVLKNNEIEKKVQLKIEPSELHYLKEKERILDGAKQVQSRMGRIITIAQKRHDTQAKDALLKRAIDEIFVQQYGHEKIITTEMTEKLTNHLSTEIVKYLFKLNDDELPKDL